MESREEDYGVINIINIKIISFIVFHITVFDINIPRSGLWSERFFSQLPQTKDLEISEVKLFQVRTDHPWLWEVFTKHSDGRWHGEKYLPKLNSCLEKLLLPNFPIPYLPRPRTNVWESESITDFKTFPFNTCWGRGKIFQNYMLTFHIFQGHGKI